MKILFLFGLCVGVLADGPIWKTKPAIYRKITNERFVYVKAETEERNKLKFLHVISAGLIEAPSEQTHKIIMDFDSYSKIIPFVLESVFDKETGNVFVHGAFLGYHLKMTVRIDSQWDPKTHSGSLKFQTLSGHFTGMKGEVKESPAKDGKATEISMEAGYLGETLPLPQFFINWGIEIAGQRAASAMREKIEAENGSKKTN